VGIKPKGAPDGFTQRGRVAVGVVLQALADGVIGGYRPWARPERSFVRRQLEHPGDPGRRASARNIRIDREYAGTRLRTLPNGHLKLPTSPAGHHRRGGTGRVPSAEPQ